MTTKLRAKWGVNDIAAELLAYDVQKVYWSATESGSYVEATIAATRVVLVAEQKVYYFDYDAVGAEYWFKVASYNTVSLAEGIQSTAFQAPPVGGYATVTDARAAGVPLATTDGDVVKEIKRWSQFIDKACRQWFEPRYIDEKLDGNGVRILWLWTAIIGVEELYANSNWDTVLDAAAYEIFNNLGQGLKDDRRNPKIVVSDQYAGGDLYRRILYDPGFVWTQGFRNQWIKGTFGFVEPDGSPPEMIQRAILKMVAKHLSATTISPAPVPAGPLISETTDGHTVRFASMVAGRKIGTIGITGDSEVEAIIQLYRAPRAMEVSSDA